MEGHDFSRADQPLEPGRALAPGGVLPRSSPRALKRHSIFRLVARLKRLRKNSICPDEATRGLKPAHISDDLRGPEGPLFHGRADIGEFFRNHFSRAEKARAKSALAAGVSLVPLEAPYHPNSQPRALKAQPGLRAGAARLKSCPSRTVPFPGRPARFIPRGRMTMAAPTGARRAAARSSGIWDRNGSRRRRARPSHT